MTIRLIMEFPDYGPHDAQEIARRVQPKKSQDPKSMAFHYAERVIIETPDGTIVLKDRNKRDEG